jgi:hypothetical protein
VRHVLAVDGAVGSCDGGLDVAEGLTHLNAGVRAAFGPDPVVTTWCAHPASVTLAKH